MAETHMTKIALVQMRCGPDPEKNFARALDFIRDTAKKGAAIVCLPELFRSQYFCQSEDHKNFELAEEVPGRSTSELQKLSKELGVVIVASLFEKRRAGVFHNTAAIVDADGKFLGNIARCTFRTIHCITRNFISRRAILVFKRGRRSAAKSASAFAGTNGIRKRR